MNKNLNLFTVFFILLIVSCGSMKIMGSASKVLFTEITRGQYSGIEEKKQVVINNSQDFDSLWKRIFQTQYPLPATPLIDFDKNTVVGVFMGTVSTGGYYIEIEEVTECTKQLLVSFNITSPAPDDYVTMALSQPFHLIVIPKKSKKIVFEPSENLGKQQIHLHK